MGRSLWNMAKYAVEGAAFLGMACVLALALIPMAIQFQMVQTVRGNPFWFLPGKRPR